MLDTDSKQLMHLAKAGDRAAFSKVYGEYFVPVFRYILLRVHNRADAEDLTQHVFLKAYRGVAQFRVQAQSPLAYFFTIARNTVIDHTRKYRAEIVEQPDAKSEPVDTGASSAEQADTVLARQHLERALVQLPEEQREVVLLRLVDGYSAQEVAVLLGKRADAVRQIQSRGLQALRRLLKSQP